MAARGVMVGFNPLHAFENKVTSVNTRGGNNTQYVTTMDQALHYLEAMLQDRAAPASRRQTVIQFR
jgi:hypothetical protein